jgi:hypothetical protein
MDSKTLQNYYSKMLLAVMQWLVERFYRNGDYRWVDTKVDLASGEDFSDSDFLRGKQTVYGWIQGRALESLTGHAIWLQQFQNKIELTAKIHNIIEILYERLENAKYQNNGHLYFFMDVQGKAFTVENGSKRSFDVKESSAFNYSDLFCAKGMYAAAKYMKNEEKIEKSRGYCGNIIDSLWSDNFVSDQYAFNASISGSEHITRSLGPYMLCLNMITNMLDDDEKYVAEGMKLLLYILDKHINFPIKWKFGKEYDCVEILDNDGLPLSKNNAVLSDSGHSLEFTGFALKFLNKLKKMSFGCSYESEIKRLQTILIKVLIQNFQNSFIRNPGGICKRFDIVGRKISDSHMPWWSLPETMRAASYAINICTDREIKNILAQIFMDCHNSFVRNFVRPDFHYTAFQAIGLDGKPMKIIPATPDADPGYHTGLSIIDCLNNS